MTKKGSQSATKNFHVLIKFKDEVPGSVSRIRITSLCAQMEAEELH